jgi:hypothetical protein
VVSSRVAHGHAHELSQQEIVIQLLHEQEIAADGVTHLEEQGPQQLLRRDGGTAFRGYMAAKSGENSRKAWFTICAAVSADGLKVPRFRGQEMKIES